MKLRKIDTSELKPKEKVLCLFYLLATERGESIEKQKAMYIVGTKTRQQKYRALLLFDKIQYNANNGKGQEIMDRYKSMQYFDKLFGLI